MAKWILFLGTDWYLGGFSWLVRAGEFRSKLAGLPKVDLAAMIFGGPEQFVLRLNILL